jgi:hypothetical protein
MIVRPLVFYTAWQMAGKGYIAGEGAGIVSVNGVPAARKILCFEQSSLQLVRSTWSDENGNYRIPSLNTERAYMVVAVDHKGEYDPVAYDRITPNKP